MAKPIKIWTGSEWVEVAIQAPVLTGYATTVDLTAHEIDTTSVHGIADTSNLIISTGSYSNPSWITSLAETKVLPSQTSNSGKFLTTNGTSSSWTALNNTALTGTTSVESLNVDSVAYIDTITTTVNSSSTTNIDSFAVSLYTSVEYLIQIVQGSKVTVLKTLMIVSSSDIVQYGIVESGGSIPYTITADTFIPGGGGSTLSILKITITDANVTSATVKVLRTSVV